MTLPAPLLRALRRRLPSRVAAGGDPLGEPGTFAPLGGGCIHHAGRLETDSGPVFLKWNRGGAATGFSSEARSLEALRREADPDLLHIPVVLDVRDATSAGDDRGTADEDSDYGWLVLEFVPTSRPAPDHHHRLGRGLAHLHSRPQPTFGWPETNRIGPLPQVNPAHGAWVDFWVEARLLPQLRATRDAGLLGRADVELLERVAMRTPAALEPVAEDAPALVHGDLWSGNVHPGPEGRPVLVDPAAYHGHGEVDLAMARLFGGFSLETFQAYREVRSIPDGFGAVRCPLYQLYYLLAHVRLFGSSYLGRTRSAARAVLKAV